MVPYRPVFEEAASHFDFRYDPSKSADQIPECISFGEVLLKACAAHRHLCRSQSGSWGPDSCSCHNYARCFLRYLRHTLGDGLLPLVGVRGVAAAVQILSKRDELQWARGEPSSSSEAACS